MVFHSDTDAAQVLRAFRSDPLFVQDNRVEVRYTLDYGSPTEKQGQHVTSRIKRAFDWVNENNIGVRELPGELERVTAAPLFTDINTTFSCNEEHTECAFFKDLEKNVETNNSIETPPTDPPTPIVHKHGQISILYKKLQEPIYSQGPKRSKSSKKKSAKKRQTLAKIENELTRKEAAVPLQPGFGRGFSQHRAWTSSNINHPQQRSPSKPCAVICPTKRDDKLPTFNLLDKQPESNPATIPRRPFLAKERFEAQPEREVPSTTQTKPEQGIGFGRGRGFACISDDVLNQLRKL